MNKKKAAALFAAALTLLSGCRHDASELTVVTGLGIDGLSGDYQVEAEVIPLLEKEEDSQSVFLSMGGKTITESINSMVAMTGRSLYCNHLQILVISRDTAREGLMPLLEEFLRGTQYPISLRLAIAKESAAKILRAKPTVTDLHSVEMNDLIQEGSQVCMAPDMNICSFYEDILSPGIEGILPFLSLRENDGQQVCVLAGTALFQGDRIASVLDGEDTQTLMWMLGKSGGSFTAGEEIFQIHELTRSLKATVEGGTLKLKLVLKTLENEENPDQLIQTAEDYMTQRCSSLLKRLRQLQCDTVGFGNAIYQAQPKEWRAMAENWPERFSSYPVEVQVEVSNVIWGRIWSTQGNQGREESDRES